MSLSQQPHLKEAILSLSEKEKDKLLVRLINKDKKLIEQLHFLLLENEDDLIKRIKDCELHLNNVFKRMSSGIGKTPKYNKHRELTGYLKSASGLVNEHASITKNKESELHLRLLILEHSFEVYTEFYTTFIESNKASIHFEYQIARLKAVLNLYNKLHEDLQYEYKSRLLEIIHFIKNSVLNKFLNGTNITVDL